MSGATDERKCLPSVTAFPQREDAVPSWTWPLAPKPRSGFCLPPFYPHRGSLYPLINHHPPSPNSFLMSSRFNFYPPISLSLSLSLSSDHPCSSLAPLFDSSSSSLTSPLQLRQKRRPLTRCRNPRNLVAIVSQRARSRRVSSRLVASRTVLLWSGHTCQELTNETVPRILFAPDPLPARITPLSEQRLGNNINSLSRT